MIISLTPEEGYYLYMITHQSSVLSLISDSKYGVKKKILLMITHQSSVLSLISDSKYEVKERILLTITHQSSVLSLISDFKYGVKERILLTITRNTSTAQQNSYITTHHTGNMTSLQEQKQSNEEVLYSLNCGAKVKSRQNCNALIRICLFFSY